MVNKITSIQESARELCEIFVDEKISIIDNNGEIKKIESTNSSNFQNCVNDLSKKMQEHSRQGNPLLTPTQFTFFSGYIKVSGYSLALISPFIEGPYASLSLSILGNTVLYNLGWSGFYLDDNAIFIIDHEIQHQEDIKELQQKFPNIAKSFNKSKLTKEEMVTKLNAYLEYFSQGLKYEQAEEFNALKEQIFGDLASYTYSDLVLVGLIFYETMRYAYENNDERLKQYVMSKDFIPFKMAKDMGTFKITNDRNEEIELKKAAIKARLIEAGLWDELSEQQDFDQRTADSVDEDLVHFFRLAIIGVSQQRL